MKFIVKWDFTKSGPYPWNANLTEKLGARNEGVEIEAETPVLARQAAGLSLHLNPFYLVANPK